ncbi:MAG: hypothetical protein LBB45_09060 [Methanobrevibacter sp.]|jgi:hypothetical protein|nr:hypothetical protein [Candidatus Methanovirga basalitermitum]
MTKVLPPKEVVVSARLSQRDAIILNESGYNARHGLEYFIRIIEKDKNSIEIKLLSDEIQRLETVLDNKMKTEICQLEDTIAIKKIELEKLREENNNKYGNEYSVPGHVYQAAKILAETYHESDMKHGSVDEHFQGFAHQLLKYHADRVGMGSVELLDLVGEVYDKEYI